MSYGAGDPVARGPSGGGTGCIFCDLPRQDDLRESLVLAADDHSVVLLNRYPYNNGHLMVAPRRHAADPGDLDAASYDALMESLRGAIAVVRRVLKPDGMNVGANLGAVAGAGIEAHLHWHVVPRWAGDTNFMPVIADVKVMPQHLLASYDQLRPHFGGGCPTDPASP
jgi:ATP adenylyltransferase